MINKNKYKYKIIFYLIFNIIIIFYILLGIGDWGLGIGDWAQSPIPNLFILIIKNIFLLNKV